MSFIREELTQIIKSKAQWLIEMLQAGLPNIEAAETHLNTMIANGSASHVTVAQPIVPVAPAASVTTSASVAASTSATPAA